MSQNITKKPLISICIPTFNRAPFLKECLNSITQQFSDEEIKEKVNIKILDNQSVDNTKEVVNSFLARFDNITFKEDDKKRNIAGGLTMAAALSDGEYIWFFSDDDLQSENSLKIVIDFIEKNKTDLILPNVSGFNDKNNIKYLNLLDVNEDIITKNKKEFFTLLSKKFYISIDYYATFCSNWILKTEIFQNHFHIFEKFNGKYDLFPFTSTLFYIDKEFNAGIIAKEIVLNRGGNESWGKKNAIKHFFYRNALWKDYYRKIIIHNRAFLPKNFVIQVRIKNIIRYKDLIKIFYNYFHKNKKI